MKRTRLDYVHAESSPTRRIYVHTLFHNQLTNEFAHNLSISKLAGSTGSACHWAHSVEAQASNLWVSNLPSVGCIQTIDIKPRLFQQKSLKCLRQRIDYELRTHYTACSQRVIFKVSYLADRFCSAGIRHQLGFLLVTCGKLLFSSHGLPISRLMTSCTRVFSD